MPQGMLFDFYSWNIILNASNELEICILIFDFLFINNVDSL